MGTSRGGHYLSEISSQWSTIYDLNRDNQIYSDNLDIHYFPLLMYNQYITFAPSARIDIYPSTKLGRRCTIRVMRMKVQSSVTQRAAYPRVAYLNRSRHSGYIEHPTIYFEQKPLHPCIFVELCNYFYLLTRHVAFLRRGNLKLLMKVPLIQSRSYPYGPSSASICRPNATLVREMVIHPTRQLNLIGIARESFSPA